MTVEAKDLLEHLFPKIRVESYFGRDLTDSEWLEVASSLAFNLEISISPRYFNDKFEDVIEELSNKLNVPSPF